MYIITVKLSKKKSIMFRFFMKDGIMIIVIVGIKMAFIQKMMQEVISYYIGKEQLNIIGLL